MHATQERWASLPMSDILLWSIVVLPHNDLKALPPSQRYIFPLPNANMTRRLP
jgi:hypothetical protein